jgi:hypothetical protein
MMSVYGVWTTALPYGCNMTEQDRFVRCCMKSHTSTKSDAGIPDGARADYQHPLATRAQTAEIPETWNTSGGNRPHAEPVEYTHAEITTCARNRTCTHE